ncbi:hypothetical protein JRI60_45735 [Archangium violaceum]|uniref:hypothetical protein n=1 Tax=Archangium violaceum TaxID=83451 RepID=UPI00195109D1|nr:hypothetical protein [Archangium violaceum]QRN96245.1 hypothetical protein JRI60_45735 [Archangium violaceum]
MNVGRLAQAVVARAGTQGQRLEQGPRRESAKPEQARKSSPGGAPAGKSAPGGDAGAARGARRQEGMEVRGDAAGASQGGFEGVADKHGVADKQKAPWKPQTDPARFASQGQAPLARETPAPATPELSREQAAVDKDAPGAERRAVMGRAQLRAAVVDRLVRGLTDLQVRLSDFLKSPARRQGVVSLSLVLSESSVTHELWQEPMSTPEGRMRLIQMLGLPLETDDGSVARVLVDEVRQAFKDFHASVAGRKCRQEYAELMRRFEEANVLPVVAGHDTGPMVAELTRLGVRLERDFTLSLLVDPHTIAVGFLPDEGSATQVMVTGLNAQQLGALIAQMRRLNNRLSNRQVRILLHRLTFDVVKECRRSLGQAEVRHAQELALQHLRLQAYEYCLP